MATVTIQPKLITWARERASLGLDKLALRVGTAKNPAPISDVVTGQLDVRHFHLPDVGGSMAFVEEGSQVDSDPILGLRYLRMRD